MCFLSEIDKGKFRLDQTIPITPADLRPTYSLLRDKYPGGNVDVSIRELLSDMVSLSDNDACDILLKQLGDAKTVNEYVTRLGVGHIAIQAGETQMAASWPVQYTNWCEPFAQIRLLHLA